MATKRNTKEAVIKVLRAESDLLYDLHKMYSDPANTSYNEERAGKEFREMMGVDFAIDLLTNQKFFNDIWDVFFDENGERRHGND